MRGERGKGSSAIAVMNGSSSGSSLRMLSISSSRPRFHVAITEKIAAPTTSGNQPPSMNFSAHDTTSTTSSARNRPVAAIATGSG